MWAAEGCAGHQTSGMRLEEKSGAGVQKYISSRALTIAYRKRIIFYEIHYAL